MKFTGIFGLLIVTLWTVDAGTVYKTIKKEGTGPNPQKNQTVVVHYTGTLQTGEKFDSSRDRNEPFKFRLDMGEVIRGWDAGVGTMKVGERAELEVAPEDAYGAEGFPPTIPPSATLIFDIELLAIEGLTPMPSGPVFGLNDASNVNSQSSLTSSFDVAMGSPDGFGSQGSFQSNPGLSSQVLGINSNAGSDLSGSRIVDGGFSGFGDTRGVGSSSNRAAPSFGQQSRTPTSANTGSQMGGGGFPGSPSGTTGFARSPMGPGGFPGSQTGRSGFPEFQSGSGGFTGSQTGTVGFPGLQPGSGGFPGSQTGSGGFPGSQTRPGGFPGSQTGSGGFPGSQTGSGGFPGSQTGSGGFPGSQTGSGGFPGSPTGTSGFPGGLPGSQMRSGFPGSQMSGSGFPGSAAGESPNSVFGQPGTPRDFGFQSSSSRSTMTGGSSFDRSRFDTPMRGSTIGGSQPGGLGGMQGSRGSDMFPGRGMDMPDSRFGFNGADRSGRSGFDRFSGSDSGRFSQPSRMAGGGRPDFPTGGFGARGTVDPSMPSGMDMGMGSASMGRGSDFRRRAGSEFGQQSMDRGFDPSNRGMRGGPDARMTPGGSGFGSGMGGGVPPGMGRGMMPGMRGGRPMAGRPGMMPPFGSPPMTFFVRRPGALRRRFIGFQRR